MPNDNDLNLSASWARAGADPEAAFLDLSWWLLGGASLLVWTGLVLLLTST